MVTKYRVQYYSHKSNPSKSAHPSRKGVHYMYFGTDEDAAQRFAANHRVYGRVCVVEEYQEEESK